MTIRLRRKKSKIEKTAIAKETTATLHDMLQDQNNPMAKEDSSPSIARTIREPEAKRTAVFLIGFLIFHQLIRIPLHPYW